MPANIPWSIKPPTSDADLPKLTKLPGEFADNDLTALNPAVVASHTKYWFPDMSGHRAQYSADGGFVSAQQSWVAPWYASRVDGYIALIDELPVVLRQLTSWNRERFSYRNMMWDLNIKSKDSSWVATNLQRSLVVSEVELVPRPDLMDVNAENIAQNMQRTTLGMLGNSKTFVNDAWSGTYSSDFIRHVHANLKVYDNSGNEEIINQQVFPRMRSQFWQVNLVWRPDPFVNRLGIRYAKVEILPNLRMETLKNVSAGVIPTAASGNPDFAKCDPDATPAGDSENIDRLTTGFPVREPQITVRITYPWVSLTKMLKAGPIGNPDQLAQNATAKVSPWAIPEGLFLGCINKSSFLGYPRGRVLYNSAAITEKTSPVTGAIGYEVTHEFLINPMMEWNQTRYTGKSLSGSSEVSVTINGVAGTVLQGVLGYLKAEDQVNAQWATGFIVQMDPRTGFQKPARVSMDGGADQNANWQAVYPYPYKDFDKLLYYGKTGDGQSFPNEG